MGWLIPYSTLKKLYQSSPSWLQRAYASVPFPIRAGKIYRDTLRDIQATEFLSAEALRRLQEERLARLLGRVQASVPFYRSAFERLGPKRLDRSPLDVLRELPLIGKTELRTRRHEFRSNDWTIGAAFKANTGGSTGTPLTFLRSNATYPIEPLGASGPALPSVLAGPTCDSIDVIRESIDLPQLEEGDLVVGRVMGAYTWATATEFNFFPRATVLALDRGSLMREGDLR